MKSKSDTAPEPSKGDGVSRRRFLTAASAGVAGAVAGSALADTLADVNLNGILPDDAKLDRESLPQVRMPNRDGFIPDAVFKVDDERQAPRRRGTAP